MRVTFESSGGYSGLRLSSSLETEELPSAEITEALRALESLSATGPPRHTSQPRYRLTIHRASGPQVVDVVEPDVPPAVRPLLNELMRRARAPG